MAHYNSPDNITHDLAMQQTSFSSLTQYNKSKLANVEFTVALADRLSKLPNIKTASLHPGIVSSGFGQDSSVIKCFKCFCCCLFV
jgi:NAD(P)-dependent dehydrogenase (short-subunit alcohol dehydrogenase family)